MEFASEKEGPLQLHYRKAGEGPALLILHGVFGSGDNWLTVSKYFMPHFEVFLIDQRNHGRSPHSDLFSYDLLVEDLHDFAIQHHLKEFYLIGHSMGGKVAMNFALKYPSMLKKMVVVDIAPRYYTPHHQQIISAFRSVHLDLIKSRNEAEEAMSAHIQEADVRQFLLKNLYRNEEGSFAWRIHLPVMEKAVENIGQSLPENSKISTPTLFVKGADSRYISDKDEAEIREIFPNSALVTIAGAGHWVQAEKPEDFAAAVLKFLLQ